MPRINPSRRQACVIAVDIGGTTIKAAAVPVEPPGQARGGILFGEARIPTPRTAPPSFYATVAALIERVWAGAQRRCAVLPLVAVAHPGRFLPDGTLAPGTTPNLGPSPNVFDGLDPAQEVRRRLRRSVDVYAENDAIAQMRFGLVALLRDPAIRPRLLGETLVYLGPGTGMGGGVARIGRDGGTTLVTDGHFFDLQVPGYEDGHWTAEELFTGPAIARLIEQTNRRLASPIRPAKAERLAALLARSTDRSERATRARRIADRKGDILALLIETIHRGRITKVRLERAAGGRLIRHVDEADRAWSARDKAAVRGARRFLLGGSVGANPLLGKYLLTGALRRLRARGLRDIAIFQLPVASRHAGILGIAQAIPSERIRQAVGRLRRPQRGAAYKGSCGQDLRRGRRSSRRAAWLATGRGGSATRPAGGTSRRGAASPRPRPASHAAR